MLKKSKSQFRYSVFYTEWVSTNDPRYPLQCVLKDRSESFKTKKDAVDFYKMFKDDKNIRNWAIYDTVTNKKITI